MTTFLAEFELRICDSEMKNGSLWIRQEPTCPSHREALETRGSKEALDICVCVLNKSYINLF